MLKILSPYPIIGGIPEISNSIELNQVNRSIETEKKSNFIYKNTGLKSIRERRKRIKDALDYYSHADNIKLFNEIEENDQIEELEGKAFKIKN